MKTLATCLFLLFVTLSHAAPKIVSADPNDSVAQRFLTSSDFEAGMTLAEVEAIISSKYADWERTEKREGVNLKQAASSATYAASIELKSPRRNGQSSPLSDVYRLSFTSPLSGSTLYGITRDVTFSHLPKDRIAARKWMDTLGTYWGEPYAVAGPDRDKVVSVAFFFNDTGTATARGDYFCTTMFPKMRDIAQNAAGNIKAILAEIDSEGCHFLVEGRAVLGHDDLIVRTLSRRTDIHAYANDMKARMSRGNR